MLKKNKLYLIVVAFLMWSVTAFAQPSTVSWSTSVSKTGETGIYELVFTADIQRGWHIYSLDKKVDYNATSIEFEDNDALYSLEGEPYGITPMEDFKGHKVFSGKAEIGQKIRVHADGGTRVSGTVTWQSCDDSNCLPPEDYEFTIDVPGLTETAPITEDSEANKNVNASNTIVSSSDSEVITRDGSESEETGGSLWSLVLEAILWGFAMLLTPCVFPMVPMTISFFMKSSGSPAQGRLKAFMYGLFIVLLYTVPICIIIGLTWIIGGDAVTADIFNWLATHWLPNMIFFCVFMVFAASFFGAFEITLPSSLVNSSDKKSMDSKGLGGIFFMALTLVLVSFSCTGPIVGTVLIKSTQGEFWAPMVTMLAFSVAFALPFTILAMFPSLLKKMKSGGGSWLGSVKVVLGFIEIALGFKFLSTADQTYHWGLLDREVYLAIWIVVFSLLGFYLLGKLRFKNDDPVEKIGIGRLSLAIIVFTFVVYMIPGMWGAPLKALSGYLPPIDTQDFIVYNHADGPVAVSGAAETSDRQAENEYGLKMPLGLSGYFTIEEGLEASKREGKPVFVDITGHGCVNCREMEQRVWSRPEVLDILRNGYIMVALYLDDKTKLKEEDYMTTESGKVLKDLGRKNAYIARKRFEVNAQPNYALLDSDGNLMQPVRGYNLDVEGFIDFLEEGIKNYNK